MASLPQVVFFLILAIAIGFFSWQVRRVLRNIKLGQPEERKDNPKQRWITMLRVAFGQTKMQKRPIAAVLHLFVYIGFVIINLEVAEIVLDGLLGTHRILAFIPFYATLISLFEVLAVLVITSCAIFLIRRSLLKIPRLNQPELNKWPRQDAIIILAIEIVLMLAFLTMNSAESVLLHSAYDDPNLIIYRTGLHPDSFWISQHLAPLLSNFSAPALIFLERSAWWIHIIGILLFLNYLPISKHFHIILAFPATYFSNLKPKGQLKSLPQITTEIKSMLGTADSAVGTDTPHIAFGAKDIRDLSWKNLLDAYTCTQCGRCSAVCPANQTGKLLSPRKILIDTRKRMIEVGNNQNPSSTLLDHYITREEVLACTTCNACTEACPINLDPLDIIFKIRQYLIMEESSAPHEWMSMFNNLENNGSPWAFARQARADWTKEA